MRILPILALVAVVLTPMNSSAHHNNNNFMDVVEETRQAIVYVKVQPNKIETVVVDSKGVQPPNPLEEYMNPVEPKEKEKPAPKLSPFRSLGTGFIVGAYIITNHHVIDDSKRVVVNFENNPKNFEVRIIASDKTTDIAVLEFVDPKALIGIKPLKWEKSDKLRPGQDVWAIGHPMGLDYTVSKGIVSHTNRRINNGWQTMIQTDVAINKGNSGGPLLNMHGDVVAVNTMILTRSGGSVGLSISVESNVAKRVVAALIKDGKIERPVMGTLLQWDEELGKVRIGGITPDSAAFKAGLLVDDVILNIDQIKINRVNDIFDILQLKSPKDRLNITVLRGVAVEHITLTLGTLEEKKSD